MFDALKRLFGGGGGGRPATGGSLRRLGDTPFVTQGKVSALAAGGGEICGWPATTSCSAAPTKRRPT